MVRWGTSCWQKGRAWHAVVMIGALAFGLTAYGAATVHGASAARSVWDGMYSEAQAERGKAVYEQQCAFCHLSDLSGQGFAPPLIDAAFTERWQEGNLGDLLTIVKVTMPQDKPQSLTDAQYAEIVAYMLKVNKYPAGAQDIVGDPAALKDVTFKKAGA